MAGLEKSNKLIEETAAFLFNDKAFNVLIKKLGAGDSIYAIVKKIRLLDLITSDFDTFTDAVRRCYNAIDTKYYPAQEDMNVQGLANYIEAMLFLQIMLNEMIKKDVQPGQHIFTDTNKQVFEIRDYDNDLTHFSLSLALLGEDFRIVKIATFDVYLKEVGNTKSLLDIDAIMQIDRDNRAAEYRDARAILIKLRDVYKQILHELNF